jgi:hypothetical protein
MTDGTSLNILYNLYIVVYSVLYVCILLRKFVFCITVCVVLLCVHCCIILGSAVTSVYYCFVCCVENVIRNNIFIYVIIVLLFHVVTVVHNGCSCFFCKVIYPSRTFNIVSSFECVCVCLLVLMSL